MSRCQVIVRLIIIIIIIIVIIFVMMMMMCSSLRGTICSATVGLKSHPQYELSKRQMRGYSGMVTFYIRGGEQQARTFLSSLKVDYVDLRLCTCT